MSIVTPKEISSVRQIERLVKQTFHKSDIPDGAEVVRKRLFHQLQEISNATPEADFADVYQSTIHEQFQDMDKDELIRRLIWLQLKETIAAYNDSEDLNAGYNDRSRGRAERTSSSVRLFINIGQKDGITNSDKLLQFLLESTDMEPEVFGRITVRDLSSFFNVPFTASEYLISSLSAKKFKGRKIKIEEADRAGGGGGGGYSSRPSSGGRRSDDSRSSGGGRDSRPSYGKRDDSRPAYKGNSRDGGGDREGGSSRKFNKRY